MLPYAYSNQNVRAKIKLLKFEMKFLQVRGRENVQCWELPFSLKVLGRCDISRGSMSYKKVCCPTACSDQNVRAFGT